MRARRVSAPSVWDNKLVLLCPVRKYGIIEGGASARRDNPVTSSTLLFARVIGELLIEYVAVCARATLFDIGKYRG